MDDQPRKYENREWMQVQQPASIDGDQYRRGREHSRIGGFKPMAWPTRHMSQAGLDRFMAINYILKLQSKTNFCKHCRYRKQT